jgi:hypothetical protein
MHICVCSHISVTVCVHGGGGEVRYEKIYAEVYGLNRNLWDTNKFSDSLAFHKKEILLCVSYMDIGKKTI